MLVFRGEKRNKKKRVKFAENVMVKEIREEKKEEEQRKKQNRERSKNCMNQTKKMPANRIALYNGIMRDRGNRIAC